MFQILKNFGMARIWTIAQNYFKYKMIGDRALPDALDVLSLSSRKCGTMETMENVG